MQIEQQEIQTVTATSDAGEDIAQLWGHLSSPRQQIVLDIIRAFTVLDKQDKVAQDQKNQGAIDLLRTWRVEGQAEWEAMTDEERAQAEEEWEDFKASMNANRAPGPPIFP